MTDRKITHYLLSEEHPEGRANARFFRSLGFDRDRPDELRAALRELAMEGDLIETNTEFGVKYAGIGLIIGPSGIRAPVLTVWMLDAESQRPVLVTAYPR